MYLGIWAHISHFNIKKIVLSDFYTTTSLLNKIGYADLHTYAHDTFDTIPFIPPFISISHEKVDETD